MYVSHKSSDKLDSGFFIFTYNFRSSSKVKWTRTSGGTLRFLVQLGQEVSDLLSIRIWFGKFSTGHMSTEDDERSGDC